MDDKLLSRRLRYIKGMGWIARCKDCLYSTGYDETLDTINLKYETHFCSKLGPKVRRIK